MQRHECLITKLELLKGEQSGKDMNMLLYLCLSTHCSGDYLSCIGHKRNVSQADAKYRRKGEITPQ